METAFPARHRLRRRSSVSDLAKPVVPAAIGSELDPYVEGVVFSGNAPFNIGYIPRSELETLPDGFSLGFWVAVDFSGEKNLPVNLVHFGFVNVTVYRASTVTFPKPSVLEANGGTLRPEDAVNDPMLSSRQPTTFPATSFKCSGAALAWEAHES
jgi:hypothetical protein